MPFYLGGPSRKPMQDSWRGRARWNPGVLRTCPSLCVDGGGGRFLVPALLYSFFSGGPAGGVWVPGGGGVRPGDQVLTHSCCLSAEPWERSLPSCSAGSSAQRTLAVRPQTTQVGVWVRGGASRLSTAVPLATLPIGTLSSGRASSCISS